MSLHENDISWQMLRRIVHEWLGTSAELAKVKPLVGGCINTTLALTTVDDRKAVLKITPHRLNRAYLQEAYQLNYLRQLGLPTPQVYACTIGTLDDPISYLLMEFVEGVDLNQAKQQCSPEQFDHLQMHLAETMAAMHQHCASSYRRLTEEPSDEIRAWPAFYRSIYDQIWHETEKMPLLAPKLKKQIGKIHDKLDRLIQHDDCPRLVHWDLWATNVLAAPDAHGKWWITAVLDPNCKFAHAEAEIAYMDLFHTVTPAFMRAYQQKFKLSNDYHRIRKPIYQLYPLVNHVHLFGHDYVKPLTAAVEKLSALI